MRFGSLLGSVLVTSSYSLAPYTNYLSSSSRSFFFGVLAVFGGSYGFQAVEEILKLRAQSLVSASKFIIPVDEEQQSESSEPREERAERRKNQ
jgi:hypothetical protein